MCGVKQSIFDHFTTKKGLGTRMKGNTGGSGEVPALP